MIFDFEMPSLEWHVCHIPKPKKPGEFRKITIPNDELKAVQRRILRFLYKTEGLRPSAFAHGFVPRRNTSTGVARLNRKAEVIACMDVKDFFDNFPLEPIRNKMRSAGLPESLIDKILQACSYKGTIPQGGPCSPALTNIGMFETDLMLGAYAKSRGYSYTRYADDLTFSKLPDDVPVEKKPRGKTRELFYAVGKILEEKLGLHLKHSKDHVIHINSSQKRQVLGVVIRKDGLGYNAPRGLRRKARAMACNLARKLQEANGVPTKADYAKWSELVGYVRYFDNLRSYSDAEAAGADPMIQERFWNYLESIFGKGGKECRKG